MVNFLRKVFSLICSNIFLYFTSTHLPYITCGKDLYVYLFILYHNIK